MPLFSFSLILPKELLTSPFMKKMNPTTLQEDVSVALIGGISMVTTNLRAASEPGQIPAGQAAFVPMQLES